MEKIKQFLKTRNGLIVGGVILIIVGFFGGMEYKAYQVRTAINDIGRNIQKALGGTPQERTAEEIKKSEGLSDKVIMQVVDKSFSSERYNEQIVISFKFTNNTDKDIQGITGTVSFLDIFGKLIMSSSVSYDKGIKAREEKVYKAGIDYNQFMDDHIKLRNTDLKNIKVEWSPAMIVYSDGTKEE